MQYCPRLDSAARAGTAKSAWWWLLFAEFLETMALASCIPYEMPVPTHRMR